MSTANPCKHKHRRMGPRRVKFPRGTMSAEECVDCGAWRNPYPREKWNEPTGPGEGTEANHG